MIKNIPEPREFQDQGIALLNLAWDKAYRLIRDIEEFKLNAGDFPDEEKDYWHKAQVELTTAYTLILNGAEFLLKGKIALITPLLLIRTNHSDWPKRCDKVDTDFSKFRTVDAQDLIRIHDTVADVRLNDSFKAMYEKLRSTRNTLVHTIDKNLKISAVEIITSIHGVFTELHNSANWISIRRSYLEEAPHSLWSVDFTESNLIWEISYIFDALGESDARRVFGIDNKQRFYTCPICARICEDYADRFYPKTAQLVTNKLSSTNVYCFVCKENIKVVRKKCDFARCKGNVIYIDDHICLKCDEYQEFII